MARDARWLALRDDLARSVILSDFDGTLAEIRAEPEAVRPLDQIPELCDRLSHRAHTMAIISGRPVSFLEPYFTPGVHLSGLYGIEARVDGRITQIDSAAYWADVVDETVTAARRELPEEVFIEAKGLALTLHYRAVPQLQATIETWASERAVQTGLHLARSRCSVELNPPIEADKGTVVTELVSAPGVRQACFIGDDRADVAAMRALQAQRERGVDVVNVAVESAETPPELLAVADFAVSGPSQVVELLRQLLDDDC